MSTDHKVCASCGYVIDGATRESYEAEIERLREERDELNDGCRDWAKRYYRRITEDGAEITRLREERDAKHKAMLGLAGVVKSLRARLAKIEELWALNLRKTRGGSYVLDAIYGDTPRAVFDAFIAKLKEVE